VVERVAGLFERKDWMMRMCVKWWGAVLLMLSVAQPAIAEPTVTAPDAWEWETVEAAGEPTARHEAGLVACGRKLYLLGGRRVNPTDIFDPATNTWTAGAKPPVELHHFQAVELDGLIYLMGAMTGRYPYETPLERVVIYDPAADAFSFGHEISEDRRRGGGGCPRREDLSGGRHHQRALGGV